jgi:nicotinamidase-related amidase
MNRALLVIDVQNEYVSGALPIAHPPKEQALANIARTIAAARAAEVPIVLVRQTNPEGAPAFAAGSPGWELHPVVQDGAEVAAHLVDKVLPSSFTGTGLDDWLRERGIDLLTVVGFMTQNCVSSTVRDAVHRGYAVEVLADATGTVALANSAGAVSAEDLHRTTLVVLQSRFAAVASTDDWIDALNTGAELERSSLLASAVGPAESLAEKMR